MEDKLQKAIYDNLWNTWIQAREQKQPEGFYPVVNNPESSPNYFMTPENMTAILNAFTPYDLYEKPNYNLGYPLDYATSAFNINNLASPLDVGINNTILQASQDPKSNLSYLYSQKKDLPNNAFTPQGIYEHEIGHSQDPRLNPYRPYSYPNLGYITRFGLEQPLLMREAPAMVAEDKFWNKVKNFTNAKK